VILGFQGEVPGGFSIQGLPGDAEATRRMDRVIVGTAIKFRSNLGGEFRRPFERE
jgi:hypothetical protein